jgi:hypothetical protein
MINASRAFFKAADNQCNGCFFTHDFVDLFNIFFVSGESMKNWLFAIFVSSLL